MLVDSHCHLFHPKFDDDETPENRLEQAHKAGVGHLVTIACTQAEWAPAIAFAKGHPQVSVAAGIHPHNTGTHTLAPTMAELETLDKSIVALGETGLDYHYDFSPRKTQQTFFHAHLSLAEKLGLPVVIHTREAEEDTIAILKEHPNVPFVLHCFSGTAWLASQGLALGGYLSFSGILTFKKGDDIRTIAAAAPRNRVLLETDAPYLAPVPFRSKTNTPAYLPHTAAVLATCWGVPVTEVARQTTQNVYNLFTRIPRTL